MIITAKNAVKTGTKFVYKPDVDGPTNLTPFIKNICAKKDGNIIIISNINIPLVVGNIKELLPISKINPGNELKKAM